MAEIVSTADEVVAEAASTADEAVVAEAPPLSVLSRGATSLSSGTSAPGVTPARERTPVAAHLF